MGYALARLVMEPPGHVGSRLSWLRKPVEGERDSGMIPNALFRGKPEQDSGMQGCANASVSILGSVQKWVNQVGLGGADWI